MAGVYLDVDLSKIEGTIQAMKAAHSKAEFEKLMYRAFRRTGGHVRKIMKTEVPKEYNVKAGPVGSAVKSARTTMGGGNVQCNIPIEDTRGSIGGRYNATGGRHGWKGIVAGKRYKIKAQIYSKSQSKSVLPVKIEKHNDNAPFRNLSAPRLNKVAFVREGKDRLPIAKVVGIAIPQMPMNRAQDAVQEDILNYLKQRIEHEHRAIINNYARK